MEKEILVNLIDEGLSIYEIAKKVGKSPTTTAYWLKKFGLKSSHKSFKDKGKSEYGVTRICPCCKIEKEIKEFYSRRNKIGSSVYCKKCSNDESANRQRKFKLKCVEYKGGECEKCGYNKYIGALDFHHIDPTKKDFILSRVKSHKFTDKIKEELDKCMLVCSNCHREIHGSLV